MGFRKYFESEQVKILDEKKSKTLRSLLKQGKLQKKDWAETTNPEEEEEERKGD